MYAIEWYFMNLKVDEIGKKYKEMKTSLFLISELILQNDFNYINVNSIKNLNFPVPYIEPVLILEK